MRLRLFALLGSVFLFASAHAASPGPSVLIKTNLGNITVQLNPQKAPKTVANFLRYVDAGFYNGTIFHRVMPGFMIQGGGLTVNMVKKPTHAGIPNESDNGLKNVRGSIAMARTMDPNSATSQFFINLHDNPFLNYSPAKGDGYAVFGKVTRGMNVVDKIAATPTTDRDGRQNVPIKPVVIESISLIK
jgi:peptidyl-prolyl cis-trans isomerase A (cyclophilin A)